MTNITQFPIPALPISGITGVSSATMADTSVVVQSGVTGTETNQQIFNLFLPNLFLNYAGNPNGNVAGVTPQYCYDTTDLILYLCTATGNASSAVWKSVASTGASNWTPLITGSSANPTSITYSSQIGEYIRLVNSIQFNINIALSALTIGAASGTIQISLPIAAGGSSSCIVPVWLNNYTWSGGYVAGVISGSILSLNVISNGSPGTESGLSITGLTSASAIKISGSYFLS